MGISIITVSVVSAIWGFVAIIAPFFFQKGENRGVIRTMLIITGVCCWLFWFCTYMAQMNPLIGPTLDSNVMAIMRKKW